MNLFELGVMELEREKLSKEISEYNILDVIDKAVKIRKYLDLQDF